MLFLQQFLLFLQQVCAMAAWLVTEQYKNYSSSLASRNLYGMK